MRIAHLLFAAFVALVIGACATQGPNPLLAPQPGYPCGIQGVVCMAQQSNGSLQPTGMCCNEGEACGGSWPNVGCPAGECCYEGTDIAGDNVGESPLPAHHHTQWKAGSQ